MQKDIKTANKSSYETSGESIKIHKNSSFSQTVIVHSLKKFKI